MAALEMAKRQIAARQASCSTAAFSGRSPARPPSEASYVPSRERSDRSSSSQNSTAPADLNRRTLFGSIAPVYDELNNALSFGQHRVWKKLAVEWAQVQPGCRALDVCCGSGDLALLLAQRAGTGGQVAALDFASEMLQYAEQRSSRELRPGHAPIDWVEGDALSLPFDSSTFDAATMGYGLRNVDNIPRALRELHRVLRPSCHATVLDFNNNSSPVISSIQGFMLDNLVVPAASKYGLQDEYAYLRPSIQRFPSGKQQEDMARAAGFTRAVHYELAFGLMGVLVLQK